MGFKKTLDGNTEHIERTILRPWIENFYYKIISCKDPIYNEFIIKKVEYLGNCFAYCEVTLTSPKAFEKQILKLKIKETIKEEVKRTNVYIEDMKRHVGNNTEPL